MGTRRYTGQLLFVNYPSLSGERQGAWSYEIMHSRIFILCFHRNTHCMRVCQHHRNRNPFSHPLAKRAMYMAGYRTDSPSGHRNTSLPLCSKLDHLPAGPGRAKRLRVIQHLHDTAIRAADSLAITSLAPRQTRTRHLPQGIQGRAAYSLAVASLALAQMGYRP